jgi:hypothetical protein
MQRLIRTGLVLLIRESALRHVSAKECEKAYEAFAQKLFEIMEESSASATHSSLCYAKAEFVSLKWHGS